MPDDARYILENAARLPRLLRRLRMERLPVETALTEQTRAFKAIGTKPEEDPHARKFMIARDVAPEVLDWGQLRWLSQPALDRRRAS